MTGERWLSAEELAVVADVTPQAARAALRSSNDGKPWRGMLLSVRVVRGSRGGRAGVRYELAFSSLLEALQRAFNGNEMQRQTLPMYPAIIRPADLPAPNQGAKIERRWRVIQEAIDAPKRSPERKAEIERASRKWNVPIRTIHRWIADLEATGFDVNALAHKLPSDAGQRRVFVSRKFDAAYREGGYPADQLDDLAEAVTLLIKRGWASPAQRAGWKQVRREVITAFRSELDGRGIGLSLVPAMLSQRRIMESQRYRKVDIRANDRKRYDDMKPRIRRDNTKFAPMEQIVMDVKPLDVVMRRPDGSEVWPKMIGFMDTGTHRLFRHFVMLAPGEGVRQEHVAEAFIAMVMHPEWGFPQQLYRDNGSEFFILDKVRDALSLINLPGARTIINAKSYSGASKPIESKFATLDRLVFCLMKGWAGGNRMNKKIQTLGKPPAPYPGGFEDFVHEANERIEVFEHDEIGSGPFKGQSPQGCFAAHVANGWRPVAVHPTLLDSAFCKRDTRRVDRGVISIDGVTYRHPELPTGETLPIALPWRRGATPLVDIPGLGWAALIPEMHYLPGDIAGAIESGRMQQANDRATRQLSHHAAPLDLQAGHRARISVLPTRAAPAPLLDIAMSDEAKKFTGARIEAADRQAAQPSQAEMEKRRIDRQTERLLKKYGPF